MSTPQTGQGETSEQVHHSEGRLHVQCKKELENVPDLPPQASGGYTNKKRIFIQASRYSKGCVYISVHVYIHGGAVDVDGST